MNIKLIDLEPQFLKRIDDHTFKYVDLLKDADGIMFVCPLCFENNGNNRIGVHSIICWALHVPQTTTPVPGRWNLVGTGYHDLTLQASSSSILLTGGCRWHGFIRAGIVT